MKHVLLGILALMVFTACSKEPEPLKTIVDITAGKTIAEADCSGCHGMDGRGETARIPNLAAQPAEYLVSALLAYRDGSRHHVALRDLATEMSEADIANISAYYASLPALTTMTPVAQTSSEAALYQQGAAVALVCEECHGEKGNSTNAGIPNLAGQQTAYLIVSTQDYKSGNRGHAEKAEMLKELEQVDIEKMAIYFASQTPEVREAPPFGDPLAGEPLSADCGSCHGADGVSHDPLVPSLASQEPNYLVAAIRAYRDSKRSHEDMVTDRSDEDIESIAAYYSVQKAEAAIEQQKTVQQLAARCDRCHDRPKDAQAMVVPSLNGQSRDYLIRAMKDYRREDRGNSMMHKMSANYSDEMIEAIANHYSRQ